MNEATKNILRNVYYSIDKLKHNTRILYRVRTCNDLVGVDTIELLEENLEIIADIQETIDRELTLKEKEN